jgi:hypothetical protein
MALGAAWHGVRGLRLAGQRETAAAAISDLRKGEVERGPSRGIGGGGNYCGFQVHRAPAKLTEAEATAETQRGR